MFINISELNNLKNNFGKINKISKNELLLFY